MKLLTYKHYLYLVDQRDKNHSPKNGFTLLGYFWQTLLIIYGKLYFKPNKQKLTGTI